MQLVVVVERRNGQVPQRCSGGGLGHPRNVITLHRLDGALGHPVALWTSDECRDRLQADFPRERQRLIGNVAGTVVAQPLDFAVTLQRTRETVFDRLKHQVAQPGRRGNRL